MGIYVGPAPEDTMSQVNLNKQTPKPDVMPPSQVLVYSNDQLEPVAKIVDGCLIHSQQPPKPLPGTATGGTIHLPRNCKQCGDEFPVGAAFCIACGAPR